MKKIKSIIAVMLAVVMMITATPVFAASIGSVSNDLTIGEDKVQLAQTTYDEIGIGTSNTAVYLTVDNSNVIVGVPTKIIVSGTPDENGNYYGDYSITASGDTSGSSTLTIEPDSYDIELQQTGKNNIPATITQEQTTFTSAELSATANTTGRVNAVGLTAGSWNSEFVFTIRMETVSPYGTDIQSWDISATENDDVLMTYYQPKTEVVAYGLARTTTMETFEDGTVLITGTGNMEENLNERFYDLENLYNDCCAYLSNIYEKTFAFASYDKKGNAVPVFSDRDKETVYIYWGGTWSSSIVPHAVDWYDSDRESWITTDLTQNYTEAKTWCNENAENYIKFVPKKVIIQDGVTNVSKNAFKETAIEQVIVSDTVESIDTAAFYGCTQLTSVTIGNNVTSIKTSAFNKCTALETITIPTSVLTMYSDVFRDCTQLKDVIVGNGEAFAKKGTATYTFANCTSLKNVKLPDNLTVIPTMTFNNCTALETITIPDSVITIDSSAFNGSGLTSIIIPNSVTSINQSAFGYCSKLSEVTIGDNVTTIGNNAFVYCRNITDITIPTSVGNIGIRAFYGCSNMTTVYIPSSVTTIGNNAFVNMASGSTIYCETQEVADLLIADTNYTSTKTTVVVDASKF